MVYPLHRVNYFILKIISLDVYEESMDLSRIIIEFLRERVLSPLAGF